MKKYINYIGFLLIGLLMFSCQKESFNYKPGYVGSSKITYYPVITKKGADTLYVAKGGAFIDPGVSAKANNADVKVTTSSVSTAAVGVYPITYTAINTDGIAVTATRTLIVYPTDAVAQANNFSGNYARNTNGSLAVWTKIAPGVYSVFNPGGSPGTDLTVVVFNDTGSHVFIPKQSASDGSPTSSAQESNTPGPGGTLAGYSWIIINPTYGTAVRVFNKQ